MSLAGYIQYMELQESAMTEQLSTYTQKPCLKTVDKIPENLMIDSCGPRNINSLRYADDSILMAQSEELKNLLMMVKEESEKAGIKLNIQKVKTMASGPITSWQIDGEKVEAV